MIVLTVVAWYGSREEDMETISEPIVRSAEPQFEEATL